MRTFAQEPGVEPYFHWTSAATLPAPDGLEENPGVAGAFSGVHNDALIIAGGANFPADPPWKGGKKAWRNTIYVLSKQDSAYRWENTADFTLEQNAAFGASVSTPDGLLCIGGDNEQGMLTGVRLLGWDPVGKKIVQRKPGDLPPGFLTTGAFYVSGVVYVAGIHDGRNSLICIPLDALLNNKGASVSWKELPGCPGLPRTAIAYAAQNNGRDMCLYLFSGRGEADGKAVVFSDGYSYNTRTGQWRPVSNAVPAMAAPAMAYGPNTILIFGGDNGLLFQERSLLESRIRAAVDQAEADSLRYLLTQSFISHSGFSRQVYAYNTVTGTFQELDKLPLNPPVVTMAILWDKDVILPSGEIKPGIRTPAILKGEIKKRTGRFGALNYTILSAYFLVLILIGIFFSYRQKSTDDYFKGGGRVPWWAAGLSVFGTALSAITFMAIPAKTFATDWAYFFYNLSILLATPLVIALFIPFYRRLNVTTAYEYLEKRFNLLVRLFGSLSFIIFQIGRIAIVLYLPSIALSLVTGVNIYYCIAGVGVLSIVYTLIGGIEAVIWTDVVQVFVLMGGAILSLIVILAAVDIPPLVEAGVLDGKFNLADLRFTISTPTIWVVVAGGFFANLITYSSDQTLVQRYLTTSDEAGAKKTAWTNALLVIPSTLLFFGVGTALYMYYIQHPQRLDPFAQSNDAIFPWFIVNDLPDGVSGLLIAGLFSAAMSSLSSSINSTGTAFTTDFYLRFNRTSRAGDNSLKVAKLSTLVAGLLGTCFAFWMASTNILSLWDQFFKVLGLFTGGLGGVFLLGIISTRANSKGAVAGLLGSAVVQYGVSVYTHMHIFLYAATGLLSCVAIGYLVSILVTDSNIKGKELTIYNRQFSRNHDEQNQI